MKENEPWLEAWEYDPKFHALKGSVKIFGQTSASGEVIYRVPSHVTLVRPPLEEKGRKAVFMERTQHWIVVSDHRGERWRDWDGKVKEIERLGNPDLWGMRRIEE